MKRNRTKKYRVNVPTSGTVIYEVQAKNPDDAKQAVLSGEGEWIDHDYSEDLDHNVWEVEKV